MIMDNKTPIASDLPGNVRTGLDLESIKQDLTENLQYVLAKPEAMITLNDQYLAVAYSVRNRMIKRWMQYG